MKEKLSVYSFINNLVIYYWNYVHIFTCMGMFSFIDLDINNRYR